ncbi:MAG: hypothetical protein AAFR04_10695 [Pseudomonadota bacterium]
MVHRPLNLGALALCVAAAGAIMSGLFASGALANRAATSEYGDPPLALRAPNVQPTRPGGSPTDQTGPAKPAKYASKRLQCVAIFSINYDKLGKGHRSRVNYRWCSQSDPSDCTNPKTLNFKYNGYTRDVFTRCLTTDLKIKFVMNAGLGANPQRYNTRRVTPQTFTPRSNGSIPTSACIRKASYRLIKRGRRMVVRTGRARDVKMPGCRWTQSKL